MGTLRDLTSRAAARRSSIAALLVVLGLAFAAPPEASAQGKKQKPPQSFSVLPVTITGVVVQNEQLVATGLIGSNPFTAPLTLAAHDTGGACPILDLSVGAIDLNLLGLRVETSDICLDITAVPGAVLGDLLCAVANLLNDGVPLTTVLAQLTAEQRLTPFLNALTSILDQAFDRITANNALAGATCSVLSLALGPIDLNLLGLAVALDDCNNGPVTVDITAIQGGGLLGDLLCSLSDLLNNNATSAAINAVLFQISRLLGQILG